jgi:hypothetical protein
LIRYARGKSRTSGLVDSRDESASGKGCGRGDGQQNGRIIWAVLVEERPFRKEVTAAAI